jgi:hypothetical protein
MTTFFYVSNEIALAKQSNEIPVNIIRKVHKNPLTSLHINTRQNQADMHEYK